jgi:F-type H+-transporting ATPase subunit b
VDLGVGLLAAESGIKLLLPAANELLWGAVAFVLLFLALSRFAFPQAAKALNERSAKIRSDLEAAQRDREEAAARLADYRRHLAVAKDEANKILEDARRTGEQLRQQLHERAEQEASRMIDGARREIQGERERTVAEVRREVGSLVVDLSSRVIGESLDRERQLELVDRYIEELAPVPEPDADEEA